MRRCGFASTEELTIIENAYSIKKRLDAIKKQNDAHVEMALNILKFKTKEKK